MADLSQYIDFNVTFDLTGEKPVLILKDTGNYPSGTKPSLKGNFLITQPDTGNYGKIDTDHPDVQWDGEASDLTPFRYTPRLSCDQHIQNGTWKITYAVISDGDDTVMSKTFYLNFNAPKLSIKPNFDVFTPALYYSDKTDYTLAGYSNNISRKWDVLIQNINKVITGVNQELDLLYNGSYYDSVYQATLKSTVTYTGKDYPWLFIKTELIESDISQANTPLSCKVLMDHLNAYGASLVCSTRCSKPEDSPSYNTAAMLLNVINGQMADSNWSGLYDNISRFEVMVKGSFDYINTGAVITPYQYDCGSIVVINTGAGSTINMDKPIEFVVGDPGAPSNGDTTFTDERLYHKSILFFFKGNIPLNSKDGSYTYDPDVGGNKGRVTVTNPFYKGESVSIGTMPN